MTDIRGQRSVFGGQKPEVGKIYDDLIGIPYKDGGRDREGLDCWGLCMEIYKRLGRPVPDFNSSQETGILGRLVDDNREALAERIPAPEPFCFVTFKHPDPGWVSHIGIVLEDGKHFIHAFEKRNVCIERLDHLYWKGRIAGFHRWKI